MNHVEWRWRWSDLGTSTLLLGKRTPFRRHPRSPLLGAAGAQVIIDAVNLGLELGKSTSTIISAGISLSLFLSLSVTCN
jgi:hypothetical protein